MLGFAIAAFFLAVSSYEQVFPGGTDALRHHVLAHAAVCHRRIDARYVQALARGPLHRGRVVFAHLCERLVLGFLQAAGGFQLAFGRHGLELRVRLELAHFVARFGSVEAGADRYAGEDLRRQRDALLLHDLLQSDLHGEHMAPVRNGYGAPAAALRQIRALVRQVIGCGAFRDGHVCCGGTPVIGACVELDADGFGVLLQVFVVETHHGIAREHEHERIAGAGRRAFRVLHAILELHLQAAFRFQAVLHPHGAGLIRPRLREHVGATRFRRVAFHANRGSTLREDRLGRQLWGGFGCSVLRLQSHRRKAGYSGLGDSGSARALVYNG